jgi:hypothetical protein
MLDGLGSPLPSLAGLGGTANSPWSAGVGEARCGARHGQQEARARAMAAPRREGGGPRPTGEIGPRNTRRPRGAASSCSCGPRGLQQPLAPPRLARGPGTASRTHLPTPLQARGLQESDRQGSGWPEPLQGARSCGGAWNRKPHPSVSPDN